MAMSVIRCPSLRGNANTSGLLPMRESTAPQVGMLGMVLDQQMPTQPASAACQP